MEFYLPGDNPFYSSKSPCGLALTGPDTVICIILSSSSTSIMRSLGYGLKIISSPTELGTEKIVEAVES